MGKLTSSLTPRLYSPFPSIRSFWMRDLLFSWPLPLPSTSEGRYYSGWFQICVYLWLKSYWHIHLHYYYNSVTCRYRIVGSATSLWPRCPSVGLSLFPFTCLKHRLYQNLLNFFYIKKRNILWDQLSIYHVGRDGITQSVYTHIVSRSREAEMDIAINRGVHRVSKQVWRQIFTRQHSWRHTLLRQKFVGWKIDPWR